MRFGSGIVLFKTVSRKVVIFLLLGVAVLALVARIGQMAQFVAALQTAQVGWVVAALGAQLIWLWLQVEQFRATHQLAGSVQTLKSIIPVALANNFILVAAPSGSLSTFALFISDAQQRKLSQPKVMLGVMLFAVVEAVALSLSIGLALVLNVAGKFFIIASLPAVVMLSLTLIYILALVLGMRAPDRLERWLIGLTGIINRITGRLFHRDVLPKTTIHQFALTLADDLTQLNRQPTRCWLWPILVAMLTKVSLMGVLALTALAFGQGLSVAVLISSVAVASTLTIVSPTPLGVGIVEGALAYVLAVSGVQTERALLISLLYRGFTLWLPMLYGFVALQVSGLRAVLTTPHKAE